MYTNIDRFVGSPVPFVLNMYKQLNIQKKILDKIISEFVKYCYVLFNSFRKVLDAAARIYGRHIIFRSSTAAAYTDTKF